jgi:hypothetical protein
LQNSLERRILETVTSVCDGALTFGETLDDILHERGLSQKHLLVPLGRSKSDISRLITNRDNLPGWLNHTQVEKIARALGCDDLQLARLMLAFDCQSLRSMLKERWGIDHETANRGSDRSSQGE